MARTVQYQSIALVATVFLAKHGGEFTERATVFAKSFPVAEQQFSFAPVPPRAIDPNVTGFAEQPVVFAKPFAAAQQKFSNEFIQPRAADPSNTTNWRQIPINPEVFKAPFPAAQQQYDAHPPQGIISTAAHAEGWEGWQLDYQCATPRSVDGKAPFQPALQQFATFLRPIPIMATPGWEGLRYDYAFAKPFPVSEQQFFPAFEPRGKITTAFPDGWAGYQWENRFGALFPASAQQYDALPWQGGVPSAPHKEGWEGCNPDYRFAAPFPVASQIFLSYGLFLPPLAPGQLPPGSGKKPKLFHGAYPEPAYDAKPNKPYRPVWDKPREGEVERPAAVPLPPASLFGAAPPPPASLFSASKAAPASLALPDFKQFAPPNPMALDHHMRDVQDQADIMAVLRAMGIGTDQG